MDDCDDLEGECPNCGAEVAYTEWAEVAAEGWMGCPACGQMCEVDDVYPEA
jgi:transcription elongation factor Elf1